MKWSKTDIKLVKTHSIIGLKRLKQLKLTALNIICSGIGMLKSNA